MNTKAAELNELVEKTLKNLSQVAKEAVIKRMRELPRKEVDLLRYIHLGDSYFPRVDELAADEICARAEHDKEAS